MTDPNKVYPGEVLVIPPPSAHLAARVILAPSTAGPAGLDVIEVTQGPANEGPTTAVCPATHPYVLGGGGAAIGTKPNWIGMAVSKPATVGTATSPNAWTVEGVPDGAESFTAYAMCAK